MQLAAASFILGQYTNKPDLRKLGWLPIVERRESHLLNNVFKALQISNWPSYLKLDFHIRSSSSNLYFARVIPSIQTVLLSIGALEFKNLQYTFKNLLQPIYKMQGTFTNI